MTPEHQTILDAAAEQGVPLMLIAADGTRHGDDGREGALTLVETGLGTLREACARAGIDQAGVIGFQAYAADGVADSGVTELVLGSGVPESAAAQARALFEAAGHTAVVAADLPGRILDRLMRPYFNRALRAVEDGIAAPADLDRAIEMGLGYRQGPLKWLEGEALAHHHDVSRMLHDCFGELAYQPAATAIVASRVSRPK